MKIPQHIAIIMDGNGRWAIRRGLPRGEGHKAGAKTVERVLECCRKYGVKYLTLYAFSTENWKRSAGEVGGLWKLLNFFLETKRQVMDRHRIRLHVIGALDALPAVSRLALQKAMRETREYDQFHLTLALNYGGRAELTAAMQGIAREVQQGMCRPEEITEETIHSHLYTGELPDPDLMIRTAGEQRLSNFLLWQLSYAEFYFTRTLWPDFDEPDFLAALEEYSARKRNFGAEPEADLPRTADASGKPEA